MEFTVNTSHIMRLQVQVLSNIEKFQNVQSLCHLIILLTAFSGCKVKELGSLGGCTTTQLASSVGIGPSSSIP